MIGILSYLSASVFFVAKEINQLKTKVLELIYSENDGYVCTYICTL